MNNGRAPAVHIDSRGRFARCSRCGWLDVADRSSCAQCAHPVGHRAVTGVEPIELEVAHTSVGLSQCTLAELASLRAMLVTPAPKFNPIARRVVEEHEGRCVVASSSRAARHQAAIDAIAMLAQLRGSIAVHVIGSDELRETVERAGISQASAGPDVVIADDVHALDRAARRAIADVRYCVLGVDTARITALDQAFAIYSLVAPETLGSRRSFIARFRGADVAESSKDAELGALLSQHTVRIDEHDDASERSALARWLDAAPRS